MTLSRLLRRYLIRPLGGSPKWLAMVSFAAVMATMLVAGLWHGAAWTFVAWGGLHGLYLVVNYAWRSLVRRAIPNRAKGARLARVLSLTATYLAVVFAWVLFRAESFDAALRMYEAMIGLNGISLPYQFADRLGAFGLWLSSIGVEADGNFAIHPRVWAMGIPALIVLQILVWFAPNSQDFFGIGGPIWTADPNRAALDRGQRQRVGESLGFWPDWQASAGWAVIMSVVATISILGLSRAQTFIYFQF